MSKDALAAHGLEQGPAAETSGPVGSVNAVDEHRAAARRIAAPAADAGLEHAAVDREFVHAAVAALVDQRLIRRRPMKRAEGGISRAPPPTAASAPTPRRGCHRLFARTPFPPRAGSGRRPAANWREGHADPDRPRLRQRRNRSDALDAEARRRRRRVPAPRRRMSAGIPASVARVVPGTGPAAHSDDTARINRSCESARGPAWPPRSRRLGQRFLYFVSISGRPLRGPFRSIIRCTASPRIWLNVVVRIE